MAEFEQHLGGLVVVGLDDGAALLVRHRGDDLHEAQRGEGDGDDRQVRRPQTGQFLRVFLVDGLYGHAPPVGSDRPGAVGVGVAAGVVVLEADHAPTELHLVAQALVQGVRQAPAAAGDLPVADGGVDVAAAQEAVEEGEVEPRGQVLQGSEGLDGLVAEPGTVAQEGAHRVAVEVADHPRPALDPLVERLVDSLAVDDVGVVVAHALQRLVHHPRDGGADLVVGEVEALVDPLGTGGVVGAPHLDAVGADPGVAALVGFGEVRAVVAVRPRPAGEGGVRHRRDGHVGTAAGAGIDVHVVELASAEPQFVDQGEDERVEVGQPHGPGLGVLGRVGERLVVLGGAEGLDASAHTVGVRLEDGDVVPGVLEQPADD